MINHAWTFNAAECANRRTAAFRDVHDYDRAETEFTTAISLHEMASHSWERANPRPCVPRNLDEDYEAFEAAELQWSTERDAWYSRHLGISTQDAEAFSQWFYRFVYPKGDHAPELPYPADAEFD